MDCTICVAKTKALISFVVTAKLICVFVFAYAKSRISHDKAHLVVATSSGLTLQICLIMALSLRHKRWSSGFFQGQVSLA